MKSVCCSEINREELTVMTSGPGFSPLPQSCPEPTAITDAYGMIKIITTEIEDREINIQLLVNRVHSADEGKRMIEKEPGPSDQGRS